MTYKIREEDIAQYYRDGYIVFRRILPASLIRDLRAEADKAVLIARKVSGTQAQRLQPVAKYADQLNMKPFQDYKELPAINEALHQLLSPEHFHGCTDVLGMLLEPAELAWCTSWHRDITLKTSRLSESEFYDLALDWYSANQVNCPLYDDGCTWFVPGSHMRLVDLPSEKSAAVRDMELGVGWPNRGTEGIDPIQREINCHEYCVGMPGAVQLQLQAGDYALYRPIGWHLGSYLPYQRRATLHDAVFTPAYEAWWRQWIKGGSPRWTRQAVKTS